MPLEVVGKFTMPKADMRANRHAWALFLRTVSQLQNQGFVVVEETPQRILLKRESDGCEAQLSLS